MTEIVPTWVPKSLEELVQRIAVVREYADAIHIDIDDGILTPVLSWPYEKKGAYEEFDLQGTEGVLREIHLMVEGPRQIGVAFAQAGAERIIGHIEGFNDTTEAHGALDAWRSAGAKEVGLSILLGTPLAVIEPLVSACDVVQVMSVATIGLQGATYDSRAVGRLNELHEAHPGLLLSVDGGVSPSNIADLARAGARRFSVGSAISKSANPSETYAQLHLVAQDALK